VVKLTLIHGDAINVLKKIEDESIDLVVTDPPYGINYQSNQRKIKFEKIINDDNLEWVDEVISELYRILKKNSCFYCFTRWDVYPFWKEKIEKNGFKIKNCLIWIKKNSTGGLGDLESSYKSNFEFIIFCMKGRKILWKGGFGRKNGYFINHNVNPNSLIHPNEKPVSLIREFIISSSDKHDTVLDPFLGSGTTMKACLELKRNCIGIEIDERYIKITKKRLNWGSNLDPEVKFNFYYENNFRL